MRDSYRKGSRPPCVIGNTVSRYHRIEAAVGRVNTEVGNYSETHDTVGASESRQGITGIAIKATKSFS